VSAQPTPVPAAATDDQAQALDHLHPGWLAPLDAALIDAARVTPLGRRWLASRLVARAPGLFGAPARPSARRMPALPDVELLLEAGAVALRPLWRAQISRQAVGALHEVLGEHRYERLLRQDPGTVGPVPSTTDVLPQTAAQWRQCFLRQGVAEFRALLDPDDARLLEGISLGFDPVLCRDAPLARLGRLQAMSVYSRVFEVLGA